MSSISPKSENEAMTFTTNLGYTLVNFSSEKQPALWFANIAEVHTYPQESCELLLNLRNHFLWDIPGDINKE